MLAKIVVGLCFGDEGKGITTDFLCSQNKSNKIVVRFSGGQQAGHNVKINGVSHVHSSYGSGTLRGVPTYFTEHCTMYPANVLNEYNVLKSKGITPNVKYHPLTKVTTPSDVAYNRYKTRFTNNGTCGIGVGETMSRDLYTGHKLYAIDLTNPILLREKLRMIGNYYIRKIENQFHIDEYLSILKEEEFLFSSALEKIKFEVKPYSYLKEYDELIFEGSQGILLDMDHGIFPNVTFANTTSKNAIDVCSKLKINDIEIYYPTRCYQTRHGFGWMSDEERIKLVNNESETNVFNEWQNEFRIGELDYFLLNYSLEVDNIYSENINKNLIVTCIDQRPGFTFDYNKIKTEFKTIYESKSQESKDFEMVFSHLPCPL